MTKKILEAVTWGVTFASVCTSLHAMIDYARNRKLRKAKELTANVGLVLKLRDDEISAILDGGDYEDAVFTALDDGRYDWNGTLSISGSDVAQFNERYNTAYSCNGHIISIE